MIPSIIVFERENFLHVIEKEEHYIYFVSDDLNYYKIDYKKLNGILKYDVNIEFARKFFEIRYENLNEYLEKDEKVKVFYEKFKNETLVVGFTGGKDSVVLVEALKNLNLNFIPVYIHIPILENVLFKLTKGIFEKYDIKIVEIPETEVMKVLENKGPPRIRCQFRNLKNLYLRKFAKELGVKRKNIIVGERIFESPKRYERLINKDYKNPIQGLTNGETFLFSAQANALSKIYLYNLRSSCIPCSRCSTILFCLGLETLEMFDKKSYEILRKSIENEYEKRKPNINKDLFIDLGLYRFPEDKAKEILKTLEKIKEFGKKVREKEIYKIFKKQYEYYSKLSVKLLNKDLL